MAGKPIRYSAHLLARLALRNIERSLPERLIRESGMQYWDTATGYKVVIGTGEYRHASHLMAAVYEESEAEIIVVTVHPLSQMDVESKIRSGRWR